MFSRPLRQTLRATFGMMKMNNSGQPRRSRCEQLEMRSNEGRNEKSKGDMIMRSMTRFKDRPLRVPVDLIRSLHCSDLQARKTSHRSCHHIRSLRQLRLNSMGLNSMEAPAMIWLLTHNAGRPLRRVRLAEADLCYRRAVAVALAKRRPMRTVHTGRQCLAVRHRWSLRGKALCASACQTLVGTDPGVPSKSLTSQYVISPVHVATPQSRLSQVKYVTYARLSDSVALIATSAATTFAEIAG